MVVFWTVTATVCGVSFPVPLSAKAGSTRFLVLCGVFTLVTRYLLLEILHVDGNYLQGAFFGSRLFEFAAGMALGLWSRQQPLQVEKSLFSRGGLVLGVVTYALGMASYIAGHLHRTDAFTGVGLFIILAHGAMAGGKVAGVAPSLAYVGAYSYGLYLIHQPYVLYAGERMRGLEPADVYAGGLRDRGRSGAGGDWSGTFCERIDQSGAWKGQSATRIRQCPWRHG